MAGDQTTFGCGTYLPGFGPGNFPDFDGGGTIDGGDGGEPPGGPGDDWVDFDQDDDGGGSGPGGPSTPPVDITYWVCTNITPWKKKCISITQDSTLPPPPNSYRDQATCKANCEDAAGGFTGHGPPGGPGPGGVGPSSPPGGPSAPPGGGQLICQCKIVGKPKKSYNQGEGWKSVTLRWKQKCSKGQEKGDQATIDQAVKEELAIMDQWGFGLTWECYKDSQKGTVGADCKEFKKEGESCTGECGKIKVKLICYRQVEGGGENEGSGPGLDDDDGGGSGWTGWDRTGGKDSPGGPGTPPSPPTVPPGGGQQKPLWYCADTGGVKGCRYDSNWGPKTITYLTKPACVLHCHDDNGDKFFDGETTGSRDDTGAGGIDDGGGGFFEGGTTGSRDDTGGGLVDGGEDDFFDGGTTGSRDDTGAGGIDGGGDSFFEGGTTGSRDDTGAGGIDGGGGWTGWDDGGEKSIGGGVTSLGESTGGFAGDITKSLLSTSEPSREFDLNSPAIASRILREKPEGIEDPDVAFVITPSRPRLVKNNSSITELFNTNIDSNIEYVLSKQLSVGNWDSTRAAGVTPNTVYNSLKPEVQNLLGQIKTYSGSLLTKNQIFSMIGSRILDGTISKITLDYLNNLVKESKTRNPITIKKSVSEKVNEVAALAIVDRDKFTLDPAQADGVMKNILPSWKTLASDIDKYIEITLGGEVKKYYIKDDNTFINRSTLGISDGDYFDVTKGSTSVRLYVKSEIDHAYLLPEQTRQTVIGLLGGETGRTLEVSSSILSGIEFDYSLSAPRQPFYMLSCVLSSINTQPNLGGSFLLKDSTATYELMDTTTTEALRTSNDYIKYKANHRVFILDDEDLMLDYIQSTSSLTMKQTDILADSPKENKTIPLLTRQIPWYILVYPTNRSDLNIFNTKSTIKEVETSGIIMRQLKCNTTIVPNFSKAQTNKFVRTQTQGLTGKDVYGKTNLQARITQVVPSDVVFTTGYEQDDQFVAAENYLPSRKKTGFRLLKEIITELNTNYLLGLNGIGKSLTEFDVFSRLTLQQFNTLSRLENFKTIRDSIRNGLIEEVKVIPPINRADQRISFLKTQLVRRKVGAPADTFVSIKGTRDNETIVPPTTTEDSSFGPISR